jgi:hypothetical protein
MYRTHCILLVNLYIFENARYKNPNKESGFMQEYVIIYMQMILNVEQYIILLKLQVTVYPLCDI